MKKSAKNQGKAKNKNAAKKAPQVNGNNKNQNKENTNVPSKVTISDTKDKPPAQGSQKVPGVPPQASASETTQVPKTHIIYRPPQPDPLFVFRNRSPVSSIQFLSPALRLHDLTPEQSEVLNASYGFLDAEGGPVGAENTSKDACNNSDAVVSNRHGKGPLLKMPPPGFLTPTSHIAAGLQNGKIVIWDLKTKEQVMSWQAHPPSSSVLSVKSLSRTQVVSLGRHDSLKLWNLVKYLKQEEHTGDKSRRDSSSNSDRSGFDCSCASPVCVTEIPLGDYIGYSGCDVFRNANCIVAAMPGKLLDTVSVWSVEDKIKVCTLRSNNQVRVGSVMQLKWVEKKGLASLLVVYEAGHMCLWDWGNINIHSSIRIEGTPISLEYDQNLGSGIIGTAEDNFFIFHISNCLEITIAKQITLLNEGIGCCMSRPDSKIYVVGGWDNNIRVFSWQKHQPLSVLEYHKNTVSCLHYSASRVVNYDAGAKCNVSRPSSGGEAIGKEDEPSKGVEPMSPGVEHMLAAGSLDGSISLWKIY